MRSEISSNKFELEKYRLEYSKITNIIYLIEFLEYKSDNSINNLVDDVLMVLACEKPFKLKYVNS